MERSSETSPSRGARAFGQLATIVRAFRTKSLFSPISDVQPFCSRKKLVASCAAAAAPSNAAHSGRVSVGTMVLLLRVLFAQF
jgi:hypothetical protein